MYELLQTLSDQLKSTDLHPLWFCPVTKRYLCRHLGHLQTVLKKIWKRKQECKLGQQVRVKLAREAS